MSLIWLRHEYKSDERRAPITPEQVGVLVAAGHEVTVESSLGRVFPDEAYRAQGAEIVPPGTWHDAPGRAFILGIKEVLQEEITAHNLALKHRHIYFAHVYKGQILTPVTMRRFALGQGTLLDLEYLVDAQGKRVATFSYSAGFAGAIAAAYLWADKQAGRPPPYALPRHYLSRAEFIDELRRKLACVGRPPTALVIGANGRSGRGAAALFEALGIEPTRWGRAETAAGGPFPALLDYDIVCNCVFLEKPVPPFLTGDMVRDRPTRLSVVADVSNDLSFNPVFGLSTSTKFSDAAVRVGGVDVIEIENLPALTPLDSSLEYSRQLFPHLRELIAGELAPGSVWEKTLLTYFQHHDIPQLALECGRELGEQFLAEPGTCSVESLRTYFSNLFAKNPLSRTDRLYFVDHLMAGVSETLPEAARETFSTRLAKVELDRVYDSPAMEAHHRLLAAVYGFSRAPAFPRIVTAEARDDFYDLCDAVSAHIDQRAGPAENYASAKERFLQKLGPKAADPLLVEFLLEVQNWVTPPPAALRPTDHLPMHPPTAFLPPFAIRKLVARGFSAMYGAELPEYNRFTVPVRASNLEQLDLRPDPHVNRDTLMEEKHGAIRMPGAAEMRVVTRIFAVMGMFPVEFYDMTILGAKSLPMVATAFRATDRSVEESAFRMFCSMLHVDSIPPHLKEEVLAELEKNRRLYPKFSPRLLAMLDQAEGDGGLDGADAQEFAAAVVDAFSMHKEKVVDFSLYSKLRKISDPLADIVLESPVLNHLTPRALDIEDAVDKLNAAGIPMQTVIQGPPIRPDGVQIQLNQIARIAAGEDVFVAREAEVLAAYVNDPGSLAEAKAAASRQELQKGENVAEYMARIEKSLESSPIVIIHHKARFGEIESRGVALTVEGEAAYNAYGIESESDPAVKQGKIERFRQKYPKTHRQLHDAGWAYYTYQVTDAGYAKLGRGIAVEPDLTALLDAGDVALVPQTYHDFLPFSAAAIFRANSTEGVQGITNFDPAAAGNKRALEDAMGTVVTDRHDLHRRDREDSLQQVGVELGLPGRALLDKVP